MKNNQHIKRCKLIIIIMVSLLLLPKVIVSGQKPKIGQYFPILTPVQSQEPGWWAGVNPSYTNNIFTNMFLLARFVDIDGNPIYFNDSTFTSDFWPVTDFQIQLPNTRQAGTYYIQFHGLADVAVIQPNNTLILKESYNTTTQIRTVWINVLDTNATFRINFENVRSSEITDIQVISPQYLTGTGSSALPIANLRPFTNEVYSSLSAYPSVSFYYCTNPGDDDNGETNWTDRSLPGRVQVSRMPLIDSVFYPCGVPNPYPINVVLRGMCYEYMIDYANRTNKDIYIYIPVMATDDYITSLAMLIKDSLHSTCTSKIYVGFIRPVIPQISGYLNAVEGIKEVLAGTSDILFDKLVPTDVADLSKPFTDCSTYYIKLFVNARRNVQRSFFIGQIFQQVFGIGAIGTKIRPMIDFFPNGEGWPYNDQMMAYLNYKTNSPQQYLYGVLMNEMYAMDKFNSGFNECTYGQGYLSSSYNCYNCANGKTTNVDLWDQIPEDSVIDRLKMSILMIPNDIYMYQCAADAAWLNMKLIAYQSGPSVFTWCAPGPGIEASLVDNRMIGLQTQYFDTLWACGVNETLYDQLAGGIYGVWNSLTDSTVSGTTLLPKYQGLKNVLSATTRPSVSMGHLLSTTKTDTINGFQTVSNFGEGQRQYGSRAPDDLCWNQNYLKTGVEFISSNMVDSDHWGDWLIVSPGYYNYNVEVDIKCTTPAEVWLNDRLVYSIPVMGPAYSPQFLLKLTPGQNEFKIKPPSGTTTYNIAVYNIVFNAPQKYTPGEYTVSVYNGSILWGDQTDTSSATHPAQFTNVEYGSTMLVIPNTPTIPGNGLIDYSKTFWKWETTAMPPDTNIKVPKDTSVFIGVNGSQNAVGSIYVDTNITLIPEFKQASLFTVYLNGGDFGISGQGIDKNMFYPGQIVPIIAITNPAFDTLGAMSRYVFNEWIGNNDDIGIGIYSGAPFVQNVYEDSTIVIMPEASIQISSQYRFEEQYELRIQNGIPGDGFYAAGTKTIISFTAGSGQTFQQWQWVNDTISTPLSKYVNDVDAPVTYVIQPNRDMQIMATYGPADTGHHELTANYGWITGGSISESGTSTSGTFKTNSKVSVTAYTPAYNSTFEQWTGDVMYVNNVNSMVINMTIDSGQYAYTITANYIPLPDYYTLTIDGGVTNNGTPTGYFQEGDTVVIGGDLPLVGEEFAHWVAIDAGTGLVDSSVQIANPSSNATYLIMPGKNIIVEASFAALKYTLTVINGTGSGKYSVGDEVTITANPAPVGETFSKWNAYNFYSLVHDSFATTTYISMTSENVTVEALYKPINPQQVALNVIYGSGSGAYDTSAVVYITAYPPDSAGYAQGYEFDRWTATPESDTAYLTSGIRAINGVVKLPNITGASVLIRANYQAVKYKLNIERGSVLDYAMADSMYLFGTTLFIQADTATGDSVFSEWTGDIATIGNLYSTLTTLTIPDENTTIRATYKPNLFSLTVNNGSGSGSYSAGTIVPIVSDYGKEFQVWRGDAQVNVADTTLSSTTVKMPESDIVIYAVKIPSNLCTVNINVSDVTTFANISDAKVTIFVSVADTFAAMDSSDAYGNMGLLLPVGTYIANATASGYQNDSNAIASFNVTAGVNNFYIYMQSTSYSLKENSLNNLSVYPNPVSNKLHILIPDEQATEVIVTNILGQPVLIKNVTGSGNSLILDVTNLAKGMYNASIITNGKTYNALFVVE